MLYLIATRIFAWLVLLCRSFARGRWPGGLRIGPVFIGQAVQDRAAIPNSSSSACR
jgi:hypothetical protein